MILKTLMFFLIVGNNSVFPGDQLIGEYWTESKEGKIAIYKCSNQYCGKIIWRKEVIKDAKNPDPKLRSKSVVGLEFMKGFEYDEKKKQWIDGTVYSIDNGNTYSGKMWLEDKGKTLKMRGFIGISLIGRTATFTRCFVN